MRRFERLLREAKLTTVKSSGEGAGAFLLAIVEVARYSGLVWIGLHAPDAAADLVDLFR